MIAENKEIQIRIDPNKPDSYAQYRYLKTFTGNPGPWFVTPFRKSDIDGLDTDSILSKVYAWLDKKRSFNAALPFAIDTHT